MNKATLFRAPTPGPHLVVQKQGRRTLFLVDRKRIRDVWWSENFNAAMIFPTFAAAEARRTGLSHGDLRTVSLAEAKRLDGDNDEQAARHYQARAGNH